MFYCNLSCSSVFTSQKYLVIFTNYRGGVSLGKQKLLMQIILESVYSLFFA